MKVLEQIKPIIEELKPELAAKFFVTKIGLFGSVTRDDFTNESDIDIIVSFEKPIGIAFIDLADFLELKLNKKVDLISLKGMKPLFYEAIKNKIIYV